MALRCTSGKEIECARQVVEFLVYHFQFQF